MLERLKKTIINIPGKKINRKLLAFESDDWGTIRIPNKEVQSVLVSKKLIFPGDAFSAYDTLESNLDFDLLFNCLAKFRDIKNNPPIITANTVVANPDFNRIKSAGFSTYFLENFSETYKHYKNCDRSFQLFREGIDNNFIYPQFHAREHLNLPMWMDLLQKKNENFLCAFDLGCFSINFIDSVNRRTNLMASYDYNSDEGFQIIKDGIVEGLQIFEDLFGFKSQSTVAPCYVWDHKIEEVFKANDVEFLQGSRFQNIPVQHSDKIKTQFHYNGQRNELGQYYFQRNGLFEPSIHKNVDWVDKCMESISIAFKWNKPAIIGTHRLNFVGGLDADNRDKNLGVLDELLKNILKKWPDVEFVSSTEIQKIYKNGALNING